MRYIELLHLLKREKRRDKIDKNREEIAGLLPPVKIMFNYDQKNHAHQFDLWNHCIQTVCNLPRGIQDDMLYLAALLHDIGKPACQTAGKRKDDPNMHYYGHPEKSREIVEYEVIPALKSKGILLPEDDVFRLLYYIEYHDDRVSLRMKHLRKHLQLVPLEVFQRLMLLEVADAKAHVPLDIIQNRIEICSALSGTYGEELYKNLLPKEG